MKNCIKGTPFGVQFKNMNSWIFSIFSCFLLLSSCNYKSEQSIPKKIVVTSQKEICKMNIYTVDKFELKNIKSTSISDWQKGLICEGYSDRPMMLPWIYYTELPDNTKNSLVWFLERLNRCDINLDTVKSSLWVAACRTEYIDEVSMNVNWTYHVVFFLDRDSKILYEIRSMD